MADILRILDRYKISDKVIVYTVKKDKNTILQVNDIYKDLQGNRFCIKAIEKIHNIIDKKDTDESSTGLMLEAFNEIEVRGNILIKNMQKINFLFCNHPLYPRQVDEDYREEYQAAKNKYSCALFSYEDLQMGKLSLYGEEISGLTIYRGWMMKPELYRNFYKMLNEKEIVLINSPEEYERYHMFSGWYEDFKDETPESVWESGESVNDILNLTHNLMGSYIVKDYVKSRKHEWYDACFIENISNKENLSRVITNFINRQGSDLAGGIVLRKFEKLKQIGFHEKSGMPISEEYRIFVFAGRVLIVDDYWRENKNVSFSDEEWNWIDKIVGRIKSNFVTIDLARKEDGNLIIMELGDGQVSGIQQIKPEYFYEAFNSTK